MIGHGKNFVLFLLRVSHDINCPEVGYCAQALGYIDFWLGWVWLVCSGLVGLG